MIFDVEKAPLWINQSTVSVIDFLYNLLSNDLHGLSYQNEGLLKNTSQYFISGMSFCNHASNELCNM